MQLRVLENRSDHVFGFALDERITAPSTFRVAFLILLDGDLVMSPEHLGVAYMTAILRRAGFAVTVNEVESETADVVLKQLADRAPQLTCFTLMSLNTQSCRLFCQRLKEAVPATRIACGGPAGTYAGMDVLRHNEFADIVAVGEGEPTIFELVQRLYMGEDLSTCPGICWRAADGSLHENPVRPLMHNLDDLPFPARDQLEQHGGKLEYVRVSTSRGCVARCTFCSAPHVGNKIQKGKAWRGRSAESVLEELSHLVRTYNFRTYDFVDSTFEDPDGAAIGKGRVRKIADGILERKLDIYYNVCMRAENWTDADADLLDRLALSGLEKVNVGIESGVESELRLWEKRASVEDNVRIIRLLREHGIYLAMGFIQFHPYSTVETLRENADFLRKNNGQNLRRLTERLEIYPGTPLIKRLEADGLLGKNYWAQLDPYDYKYKDERVERLAKHFASLYNNADYFERGVITESSAVFVFETFNVVLSTFLSRLRRRFGDDRGVRAQIDEFRSWIWSLHRETAEFNYAFFVRNLEDVLADKLSEEARKKQLDDVERYYGGRIATIKTAQLKLGRQLLRQGLDITQIASTLEARTMKISKTYTGGGTACW